MCVLQDGPPGLGVWLIPSLTGPHAQAPDLQRVHQRIQDIVGVLRDFATRREEGRSRAEYLNRLQKDLATYYSYGDFLLGKLMDLFPLSEVRWCPARRHLCCPLMSSLLGFCGESKTGYAQGSFLLDRGRLHRMLRIELVICG